MKEKKIPCHETNKRHEKPSSKRFFPRIPWRNVLLFCFLILAVCSSPATTTSTLIRAETDYFVITAAPPGMPRLEEWGVLCEGALKRLTPDAVPPAPGKRKYGIIVCKDPREFEEKSGMRSEHVMAVADQRRRAMILNIEAMRNSNSAERFQTLEHEMTHLLLGALENGQRAVPMWLHEGLAQIMSGENRLGGRMRLALAEVTGNSIPLSRLGVSFPYGGDQSELAYAESLSFTRFVASKAYHFNSAAEFFHALLRNDDQTDAMLRDLSDIDIVSALEFRWRREESRLSHWILLLSGSSPLWGGMALLFLYAWWRKRHRARAVMADWDAWEREGDAEEDGAAENPADDGGQGPRRRKAGEDEEYCDEYADDDDFAAGFDLPDEEGSDDEEFKVNKKAVRRRRFR